MKVLITSGGCDEPVDGVRFISNFSSGRTGAGICRYFLESGHQAVFIRNSRSALVTGEDQNLREYTFRSFSDLQEILYRIAETENDFDAVIFAAAVSDFSVDYIKSGDRRIIPGSVPKIDSDSGNEGDLAIVLKKNPKLISSMKKLFRNAVLAGFKLTNKAGTTEREEAVMKLFAVSNADFVVSNDLTEINETMHKFTIYTRNGDSPEIAEKGGTKAEMAAKLERLVKILYDRERV